MYATEVCGAARRWTAISRQPSVSSPLVSSDTCALIMSVAQGKNNDPDCGLGACERYGVLDARLGPLRFVSKLKVDVPGGMKEAIHRRQMWSCLHIIW